MKNFLRNRSFIVIGILAVFIFAVLSCNESSLFPGRTAEVNIQITALEGAKGFLGGIADITSLSVNVYNDTRLVNEGDFSMTETSPSVWEGTVTGLIVGDDYAFTASALDSSGAEIYTGSSVVTGIADLQPITIQLVGVESVGVFEFPVIKTIYRPIDVLINSANDIIILLNGQTDETLSYELTADAGAGSFDISIGEITLAGTSATLKRVFTASSTTGSYTISVKIANSVGYTVETSFPLEVRTQASGTFTAQMAPVVNGLSMTLISATEIQFAVDVDNEAGQTLTYAWSFTPAGVPPTFIDVTTANPTLQSYDDNGGDLELTVTDNLGASLTVTVSIPEGIMPNVAQIMPIVSLFTDTNWVSMNGNYYDEGSSLLSTFNSLGYIVNEFTGITQSDFQNAIGPKRVLVFPSFYDYGYPTLASDAKTTIQTFVNDGGVLLKFDMTYQDYQFMNSLFGWSISDATYHYPSDTVNLNGTAAAGTVFETAASSLYAPNLQLGYINKSQLPSGALSIYEPDWGPSSWSGLLYMPYGSGYIIWFGNGWHNMAPLGTEDGGWLDLIGLATSLVQ